MLRRQKTAKANYLRHYCPSLLAIIAAVPFLCWPAAIRVTAELKPPQSSSSPSASPSGVLGEELEHWRLSSKQIKQLHQLHRAWYLQAVNALLGSVGRESYMRMEDASRRRAFIACLEAIPGEWDVRAGAKCLVRAWDSRVTASRYPSMQEKPASGHSLRQPAADSNLPTTSSPFRIEANGDKDQNEMDEKSGHSKAARLKRSNFSPRTSTKKLREAEPYEDAGTNNWETKDELESELDELAIKRKQSSHQPPLADPKAHLQPYPLHSTLGSSSHSQYQVQPQGGADGKTTTNDQYSAIVPLARIFTGWAKFMHQKGKRDNGMVSKREPQRRDQGGYRQIERLNQMVAANARRKNNYSRRMVDIVLNRRPKRRVPSAPGPATGQETNDFIMEQLRSVFSQVGWPPHVAKTLLPMMEKARALANAVEKSSEPATNKESRKTGRKPAINLRLLSPRIASVVRYNDADDDDVDEEADGQHGSTKNLLSPELFPLYPTSTSRRKMSKNKSNSSSSSTSASILPVADSLKAAGLSGDERDSLMELIVEASGAGPLVGRAMQMLQSMGAGGGAATTSGEDPLLASIDSTSARMVERFDTLHQSMSARQRKELTSRRYTFLDAAQLRELYAEGGPYNVSCLGVGERDGGGAAIDSIGKKQKFPFDLRTYGSMGEVGRKRALRLTIRKLANGELLEATASASTPTFSWTGDRVNKPQQRQQRSPYYYHVGPDDNNNNAMSIREVRRRRWRRAVFQPRSFEGVNAIFEERTPFTFSLLEPILFSPVIFAPTIGKGLVLGPLHLSPALFSPYILSPAVLTPYILYPDIASGPMVLSPYVFTPQILGPSLLDPQILTPYAFSPNILNPFAMAPLILSPHILSPDIMSPTVLSGAILSPFLFSPAIFTESALAIDFLSPSLFSKKRRKRRRRRDAIEMQTARRRRKGRLNIERK